MPGLSDLNNHLFAQLDRLSGAEGDALEIEIERSKATSMTAKMIIEASSVQLDALKLATEYNNQKTSNSVDKLIGSDNARR